MMPQSFLDHLVVTAPSLEAGAAFVSKTLGAFPQAGGEHPGMASHNVLLRLGKSMYLEVISPNPAAPPPDRPRLFALDDLGPHSPPRLSTWVIRTSDIHGAVAAASEPLGPVEPMSRGTLNWLLTVPADGSVPLNGAGRRARGSVGRASALDCSHRYAAGSSDLILFPIRRFPGLTVLSRGASEARPADHERRSG